MPASSNDTTTERADQNREQKLKARRALDRLLAMAGTPEFSGSITIEVAVEKGRFGRIRSATNAYEK